MELEEQKSQSQIDQTKLSQLEKQVKKCQKGMHALSIHVYLCTQYMFIACTLYLHVYHIQLDQYMYMYYTNYIIPYNCWCLMYMYVYYIEYDAAASETATMQEKVKV